MHVSRFFLVIANSKAYSLFTFVYTLIDYYSLTVYVNFFCFDPQTFIFGDLTLNWTLIDYDSLGKGNIERWRI